MSSEIAIRAALAFGAVVATALFVVTFGSFGALLFAPVISAIPIFILAFGQVALTLYVTRSRGASATESSEWVPVFSIPLSALPFALFGQSRVGLDQSAVFLIIGAILLILAVVAFGFGMMMVHLPRITHVLAWMVTLMALAFVLVPSIPLRYRSLTVPASSFDAIPTFPLAGELEVNGPPVEAHGIVYRNRATGYGGNWCEVTAVGQEVPLRTFLYLCKTRALRCSDSYQYCMVEDAATARGFTYEGSPVELAAPLRPYGEDVVRGGLELIALAALYLLYRARAMKEHGALDATALTTACLAMGLIARLL